MKKNSKVDSFFEGIGKPATDVHFVYHKFCDQFTKRVRTGKSCKVDGKQYYFAKEVWKWKGYALMTRVEAFVKKYPKHVEIVGCDDDFHAGSYIVVIQHRSRKSFFGTTLVYVPQCTGEDPIRIFLYECHRKELMKALQNIEQYHKGRSVS